MAHFAKISENNEVLDILTLDDQNMLDANGIEQEALGQQHLEQHNNWPSHLWIQTSYNTSKGQHKTGGTPFRGNYAGIGFTWDSTNQIFWPKQPFTSWVKDNATASWKSPIGDAPALTQEQHDQNIAKTHEWGYIWNEENQTWNLVNNLSGI